MAIQPGGVSNHQFTIRIVKTNQTKFTKVVGDHRFSTCIHVAVERQSATLFSPVSAL